MRGDFSAWNKDRSKNFRGTLHQQGRVLLDRDWNAQTEIIGEWQETAARDTFGAGIAAVPANEPLGFKVIGAEIAGSDKARIRLIKGHVWADGLLAELFSLSPDGSETRIATYLTPPPSPPVVGTRDVVVLETWLEELSPFQNPGLLIEPALGGVDTTERVQTAFRLRLLRLGTDSHGNQETCNSIIGKLQDDFSKKGKLTVELKPDTTVDENCPVVEGGGYTGFEHYLFRIEIADTNTGNYFKWSQFNGGLVGTGDFDAANNKVDIHGNRNAILLSGLNSFYLEALDLDPSSGYWKVIYGAKVTLGSDGMFELPAAGNVFKGAAIPVAPASGKRFFRLWNGIEPIEDFTTKKDLPGDLGIQVQFEPVGAPPDTKSYIPSDFWTFEVRAGGLGNPPKLVDNLPPQGIFYHRVPLAEVKWTNPAVVPTIEDCRFIFQPLTKLKNCCTYRVGDGIRTHGDFTSIQDAINALPRDRGGEVCILPGTYYENINIQGRHDIILRGCGNKTLIWNAGGQLAVNIKSSQNIAIKSLAIASGTSGVNIELSTGITLESLLIGTSEKGISIGSPTDTGSTGNITLKSLTLNAGADGIDIRNAYDISLESLSLSAGGKGINIERSHDITIELLDILSSIGKGIDVVYAQNIALESVSINVLGEGIVLTGNERTATGANPSLYLKDITLSHLTVTATTGSAVKAKYAQFLTLTDSVLYMKDAENPQPVNLYSTVYLTGDDILVKGNEIRVLPYVFRNSDRAFSNDPADFVPARGSSGGLHIGRGSDRVRIIDNLIINGTGNGISLGNIKCFGPGVIPDKELDILYAVDKKGYINRNELGGGLIVIADSPLNDVLIESNRIFNMGHNGIGVFGFIGWLAGFNPGASAQMISVRNMTIATNRIESCVYREAVIPEHMFNNMGWGAIALADTEDLTIQDNFLDKYGVDYRKAVCGIYAIQSDGLEISRNQITGPMPSGRIPPTWAPWGARGGIWIQMATLFSSQFISSATAYPPLAPLQEFSVKSWAAKIQENIVSVALGRTLTLGISGPVSVADNDFTTFNPALQKPMELLEGFNLSRQLTNYLAFQVVDVFAGNVIIYEREAISYALDLLNRQLSGAQSYVGKRMSAYRGYAYSAATTAVTNGDPEGLPAPAPPFNPTFRDSNVLFADNKCHQDNLSSQEGISVTSVVIATPHDAGFNSNQITCKMTNFGSIFGGPTQIFPMINTYIFGRSCRVSDNRFSENDDGRTSPNPSGLLPRFPVSALTAGILNVSTDNIATHCIRLETGIIPYFGPLKVLYLDRFNLIEIERLAGDITHFDGVPPCKKVSQPTPPSPLAPVYTLALDDIYTLHLAEKVQLQDARAEIYRQEYERSEILYGVENPRTLQTAMKRDISIAESKKSFMEYSVASVPLPEAKKSGWVVDGFVRSADGDPAPGLTVRAYDARGIWTEDLGSAGTSEKGYFSLIVEDLLHKNFTVFIRASKGDKELSSNEVKVTTAEGVSDRVEVILEKENESGEAAEDIMPAPEETISASETSDVFEETEIKGKGPEKKELKEKKTRAKRTKPAPGTAKKPAGKKRTK